MPSNVYSSVSQDKVPLALKDFTTEFGMGSGIVLSQKSLDKSVIHKLLN